MVWPLPAAAAQVWQRVPPFLPYRGFPPAPQSVRQPVPGRRRFCLLTDDLACRAAHHGLDLGDFILDRLARARGFFRAPDPFRFSFFPCLFRTGGFFSQSCHFRLLCRFGSRFFLCRELLLFHFLALSLLPHLFSRLTLFGFFPADRLRFRTRLFLLGVDTRLFFTQLGFLPRDQLA